MSEVLFDATDLAEMRAFNEANLPHTCVVSVAERVRQPGGSYTTTWTTEQTGLACRLATVGTPAERLTAGSFSEVKEFRVTFAADVGVASENRALDITHDLPGIPNPITLYVTGSESRTYEMARVVLATTEASQ